MCLRNATTLRYLHNSVHLATCVTIALCGRLGFSRSVKEFNDNIYANDILGTSGQIPIMRIGGNEMFIILV